VKKNKAAGYWSGFGNSREYQFSWKLGVRRRFKRRRGGARWITKAIQNPLERIKEGAHGFVEHKAGIVHSQYKLTILYISSAVLGRGKQNEEGIGDKREDFEARFGWMRPGDSETTGGGGMETEGHAMETTDDARNRCAM